MSSLPTPRIRATCGNGNCPTWAEFMGAEVIVAKKDTLVKVHTANGRIAAEVPRDVIEGAYADFVARREELPETIYADERGNVVDEAGEVLLDAVPLTADGSAYSTNRNSFIVEGDEVTSEAIRALFNIADDEVLLAVTDRALEKAGRQLQLTGAERPLFIIY